jgi:hypothetical protein
MASLLKVGPKIGAEIPYQTVYIADAIAPNIRG